MKKKTLLFCLIISSKVFSQQFTVMDWETHGSLNDYLIQKMHQQYDERKINFSKALASKQATLEYIKTCRSKFLRLIGDLPAKSPLMATITGTIKRRYFGYRIEKIVYESFPGHHVTANAYVPDGNGRFPAMIFLCGHEDAGKATPSYQQTAILFAKNGFVVLVIDPISQSERYQFADLQDKSVPRVPKIEHTLVNESSNLVGTTTVAYQLWDNVRGLDYLITRPDVDSSRIGCIGNSGGAIQAIYFNAYESRIKITSVCSYLSSRERKYDLDGATDGCGELPDEGLSSLEMSDYLIAVAPRPLLILAGRFDSIDFVGMLASYDDLKKVYDVLGRQDMLTLFIYDDGHGISKPKREVAVSWFRKYFYNDPSSVKETKGDILPEKELYVTATGQVNADYKNEVSIGDRNVSLFDLLSGERKKYLMGSKQEILSGIQQLSGVETLNHATEVEHKATITKDGISYQTAIIRKQGEMPIPALLALPATDPVKVIVWLHDAGKNKIADSIPLLRKYLDQGFAVLMCDIRGVGETEDRAEFNQAKYFNKEYRNCLTSLHVGRSIIGQRATDILTVMDFISSVRNLGNLPVEINASGLLALPALHASLFSDKISHLNLYRSIHSFNEILQKPVAKNWYSYVVFNVLKFYDVPDLVRLAGEGRVSFY